MKKKLQQNISYILEFIDSGRFMASSLSNLVNKFFERIKNVSLLGNQLTGKGVMTAGEGTIRGGQEFLMPPHPLTNFEIQSKSKFNGVCSRSNLSKIKDGVYVINLDELKAIGTHSIALYVNPNNNIF